MCVAKVSVAVASASQANHRAYFDRQFPGILGYVTDREHERIYEVWQYGAFTRHAVVLFIISQCSEWFIIFPWPCPALDTALRPVWFPKWFGTRASFSAIRFPDGSGGIQSISETADAQSPEPCTGYCGQGSVGRVPN